MNTNTDTYAPAYGGLTYAQRGDLLTRGKREPLTNEEVTALAADAMYATRADAIKHEVVPMLEQHGSKADPETVAKIVRFMVDGTPDGRVGYHVDTEATAKAARIS